MIILFLCDILMSFKVPFYPFVLSLKFLLSTPIIICWHTSLFFVAFFMISISLLAGALHASPDDLPLWGMYLFNYCPVRIVF